MPATFRYLVVKTRNPSTAPLRSIQQSRVTRRDLPCAQQLPAALRDYRLPLAYALINGAACESFSCMPYTVTVDRLSRWVVPLPRPALLSYGCTFA